MSRSLQLMVSGACVALLLTLAPLAAHAAPETGETALPTAAVPPPEYMRDEHGREFRVRFDPWTRFWFSAGWQGVLSPHDPRRSELGLQNGTQLGLGLRIRDDCTSSDFDCWKVAHEFMTLEVLPGHKQPSDWPSLTARLLGGRYLKYVRRPSITLPTRPPITFGIPFHIGMEFAAGTVSLPDDREAPGLNLEVFQGHLLFEFWRHPTQKRALLLGVGVSYSLDLQSGGPRRVNHRLCPFTSAMAQFHLESQDGITLFDLTGRYAPTWNDETGWHQEISARARLEQVILAVNDLPVRLFLEGEFRQFMQPFEYGGLQDDYRLVAGLSWSIE